MPQPEIRPAAVLPEKITLGPGKNKIKDWLLVPGQGRGTMACRSLLRPLNPACAARGGGCAVHAETMR